MKNKRISWMRTILLSGIVLLLIVLSVSSLIYVRRQTTDVRENGTEAYEQLDRHYAFITNVTGNDFRKEVFEGAKLEAEERKAYLEWFGNGLAVDYSKKELFKMAIASKVDGIILEGDGSEETLALIDEAEKNGIPVVTVMTDAYDSKRKSFVGISSHNLGREYGRLIIKYANKDTGRVLVLMDLQAEDSGQNIVFNAIKDTLANEGNHLDLELDTLAISAETPFSEEEAIRALFLNKEDLPDMIICLNEEDTISAYQAAVDFNLVGEASILGYSVNDTILNAISRNVITATCAVDYAQLGAYGVEALNEYLETGHVNDFVTMDVSTVTKNNVERYLEDAEEEKE